MRAAALLPVLLLAACASQGTPAAAGARPLTPMRFRRLRVQLDEALAAARRRDAAALRRASPALSNEGLALIRAGLPNDVAREDVPRYLEGRVRFGDALKLWVGAVSSGTDAEVIDALHRLDDATRGWIDAYLGRAPDSSV